MNAETLKEIKDYALTNDDIQAILEPDTKIITYPEFCKYSNIDEAFDALGRCVFLFLTESPTMGHWLCMFKRGNNTIEYFDSYGDPPEAQREWISEEQLEELGEDEKCLYSLMKQSGYKIYYNTVKYQKERNDIATCGRWVVARLMYRDLTNLQFYNLIKQEMKEYNLKTPDDWVVFTTYQYLGK